MSFIGNNFESVRKSQEKLIDDAFLFIIDNIYPKYRYQYIQDLDKPFNITYEEIGKVNKLRKYEQNDYYK